MLKYLKIPLIFFLLFLFLFPLIRKGVHAFEHSADQHCSASEKHFHDLEQHCNVCDFTLTDSSFPEIIVFQLITSVRPFVFQHLNEGTCTSSVFQLLPSRASPIA